MILSLIRSKEQQPLLTGVSMRDSHLFACHKFLEEVGGQVLSHFAKVDFRNVQQIEAICSRVWDYITTLENHALWEEEFIFNKFFTKNEVLSLFEEHTELNISGKNLIKNLKALPASAPQLRMQQGKTLYLDFRKFYATNLMHFYEEETNFLLLLQQKATDEEIRAIDKPIYQSMSSEDIVEMLAHLLPPTNSFEKEKILDDIRCYNAANFELASQEIKKILKPKEY